ERRQDRRDDRGDVWPHQLHRGDRVAESRPARELRGSGHHEQRAQEQAREPLEISGSRVESEVHGSSSDTDLPDSRNRGWVRDDEGSAPRSTSVNTRVDALDVNELHDRVTRPLPGYEERAFTPRTAAAIIRFTAAMESPPSSVEGIVAKPIADAFGYFAKSCSKSVASCSLDGPSATLWPWPMTSRGARTSMSVRRSILSVNGLSRPMCIHTAGVRRRRSATVSCSIIEPSSRCCSSGSVSRTPPMTMCRSERGGSSFASRRMF